MYKPFKHQIEMKDAMHKKKKGIVHACTGSGKTCVMADFISDRIRSESGFSIHAITAPYMVLGNQHAVKVTAHILSTFNNKPNCLADSASPSIALLIASIATSS